MRWSAGAGKWIIVAGQRRWRATERAGLTTIDCYFHEQALSESQILEEQLIENCLREDLQPLEEAKALEKLMDRLRVELPIKDRRPASNNRSGPPRW